MGYKSSSCCAGLDLLAGLQALRRGTAPDHLAFNYSKGNFRHFTYLCDSIYYYRYWVAIAVDSHVLPQVNRFEENFHDASCFRWCLGCHAYCLFPDISRLFGIWQGAQVISAYYKNLCKYSYTHTRDAGPFTLCDIYMQQAIYWLAGAVPCCFWAPPLCWCRCTSHGSMICDGVHVEELEWCTGPQKSKTIHNITAQLLFPSQYCNLFPG